MALTGSLSVALRVRSSPPQILVSRSSPLQLRHSSVETAGQGGNQLKLRVLSRRCSRGRSRGVAMAMADANATSGARVEKLGIRVERGPSESRLQELGIRSWPKWGCPASKFPWTYDGKETCYLLQGKVRVYPEGSGTEFVEFGAGDLVVFPKGMSCTWEVSEPVDKHYEFEY